MTEEQYPEGAMWATLESLEEIALVEVEVEGDKGNLKYGYVDKKLLRKLLKLRKAAGRKALKGFYEWMLVERGYGSRTAKVKVHDAWTAVIEGKGRPADVLRRKDLTIYAKSRIRGALTNLASWMLLTKQAPRDQKMARQIVNDLAAIPVCRGRGHGSSSGVTQPWDDEDLQVFYHALEVQHEKHGVKQPWLKWAVRILLKTAATRDELPWIQRDDLIDAARGLASGDMSAGLLLWSRAPGQVAKSRLFPAAYLIDEIEVFSKCPHRWGTLADLLCPNHQVDRRHRAAWSRVIRTFNKIVVDCQLHEGATNTLKTKLRYTAIRELYKATDDLVLLQQAFGQTITRLKKYDWLGIPREVQWLD
jgi:hypothetical protein